MISYQTVRPYHPANIKAQPFPAWKVVALAWVGKLLGIQFKIDGIPYGASYKPELWAKFSKTSSRSTP